MNRGAVGAVAAGGVLGSVLRWVLVEALPEPSSWPTGVFVANLVGCLVLGILVGAFPQLQGHPVWLAAGTGFCGSVTTFSSWMVTIAELWRDGSFTWSAGYLTATLGAGAMAGAVGLVVGRRA